MTQNAIVGKLRALLTDGIDSECEVVYLLCEIRKLFDKTPARARPFALNMYCHWALHVDLKGTDTIMPFLEQIDAYMEGVLVGPEDFGASHRMIQEFLFLETLRSQLRDFLAGYDLPLDLTDDSDQWNDFVKHYAGVIEDGSLICQAKTPVLKHVKQVTFTKGRDAIGEFAQIPFDMVWCVELLDGRSIDVDVNARPDTNGSGPMVSWGVHLRT